MNAKNTDLTNEPAEKVVLGKLLQSVDAYWRVSDVLQPQHFSRAIHQQVYAAIRDILNRGGRHTLGLVESHVGEEYDDGKSTSTLLSAYLRDADEDTEGGALELVDNLVDLWRRRKFLEELERSAKDARNPGRSSYDLVSDHESRIQDINLNSLSIPVKRLGAIAAEVVVRSGKSQESGFVAGFDTGLPSLDEIVGRIHAGDFGVIGARQGDGKTVLGAQLMKRGAAYKPGCFFQLEMTAEDMAARSLAAESNISVAEIEAGTYSAFDYEDLIKAKDLLAGVDVYIDDRPRLAIEQIYERTLALKRRHDLGMIVVDHLRLIRSFKRTQNKFDRIEHVTGELKAMAKELKIAVIVLSQVTRESQRRGDPSPQLIDLDGGSSIEQDADWVLGLFRRDRWLKTQRPPDQETPEWRKWSEQWLLHKGKIEITDLKRRRGDDGDRKSFIFDGKRSLIREING